MKRIRVIRTCDTDHFPGRTIIRSRNSRHSMHTSISPALAWAWARAQWIYFRSLCQGASSHIGNAMKSYLRSVTEAISAVYESVCIQCVASREYRAANRIGRCLAVPLGQLDLQHSIQMGFAQAAALRVFCAKWWGTWKETCGRAGEDHAEIIFPVQFSGS